MREFILSIMPVEGSPLSRHETDVLKELETGKTRRQIAKELFVDIETVRSHIRTIYVNLEVNHCSAMFRRNIRKQ